jgi:hypothetical protein
MNNFFRALIAGYGAKKLGGGCFGTIIVFILIWVALGQCSFSSRAVPPPNTFPAKHQVSVPDTHRYFDDLICVNTAAFCEPLSKATMDDQLAF